MTDQVDDRRAAIEAAFDKSEEENEQDAPKDPVVVPPPPVEGTSEEPETPGTPEAGLPGNEAAESGTPGAEAAPTFPVDKAPQAWKPAQKAKWEALDPDVRQEVVRREREITRTLGETAQARQFSQQFQAAVQPYLPRLNALGAHPMSAVTELLKADYILSTAPKQQRAELISKLIKDYDIDIPTLDSVLAGTPTPDPVSSNVERLVAQRLEPFQKYIQEQEQRRAYEAQAEQRSMEQTVQSFENNAAYPHFDAVRDTMADLVEIYANRGVPLDLKAAYNKAVAMDPDLSQVQAAQVLSGKAAQLNGKAQQALKASLSVKGAPATGASGAPSATDRRAIIEAAFDQAAGR
jgi:hypothetical protein